MFSTASLPKQAGIRGFCTRVYCTPFPYFPVQRTRAGAKDHCCISARIRGKMSSSIKLLNKYKKYLVEKGSITINGVSLTIAKIVKDKFQISIVPHTLKFTNLINLKSKDLVNVEFDILGKYIKNFIK